MPLERPARIWASQGFSTALQEPLLPRVQGSGGQVVLTTQLRNLGHRVERLQCDTDLLLCALPCLLIGHVASSSAELKIVRS